MSGTLDEPMITTATIAPGHDGRPEIVVTLTYTNGGTAQLSLDQEMVDRAIAGAGITDLSDLTGRPWSTLLPAADSTAPSHPGTSPEESSPCST